MVCCEVLGKDVSRDKHPVRFRRERMRVMGSWQKAFPRSPNDVPRCLRCDRNWPLCWHRGPGPAASRPRAAGYGRTEARGLADSASSHREIRTTVFPTKNLCGGRSSPLPVAASPCTADVTRPVALGTRFSFVLGRSCIANLRGNWKLFCCCCFGSDLM